MKLSNNDAVVRPTTSLWATLGCVRLLLAVVVMASHMESLFPNPAGLPAVLRLAARMNGHAAVLGFLIISGFSIAHSCSTASQGYFRRRMIRIFPVYAGAIILSLAVGHVTLPPGGHGGSLAAPSIMQGGLNLLMLQGIIAQPLTNNNVVWSLSLEWWCYMFAPLLVLCRRCLTPILLAAALLSFSWLFCQGGFGHFYRVQGGLNLLFLGWAWILGFWAYARRMQAITPIAMICIADVVTEFNRDNLNGYYHITILLAILAVIFGDQIKLPSGIQKIGLLMGHASYPLYLLHIPLLAVFYPYGLGSCLLFALILIISLGVHLAYEKPVQRGLNRCLQ